MFVKKNNAMEIYNLDRAERIDCRTVGYGKDEKYGIVIRFSGDRTNVLAEYETHEACEKAFRHLLEAVGNYCELPVNNPVHAV